MARFIEVPSVVNDESNLINLDAVSAIVSNPDEKGCAFIMAYPSSITVMCPLSTAEVADLIHQNSIAIKAVLN